MPPLAYTRRDLMNAGMTRHSIEASVRSGALRHVLHEVYADGAAPDTIELRVAACAKVLRPDQVIVDRTAAWLHGVDALTWGEHDALPPVEVCAMNGREPVRRVGVSGGERALSRADVMTIGEIRVTTPVRTTLDLGCRLRRREAYAVLNELARVARIEPAVLRRELPRYAGRRGVIQLRELLPLIDPRLESHREAWVWLALHDAGLPAPTPQLWVGGGRFRLDFAYQRHRIALEYDGEEWHTGRNATDDEARREWLRRNGWRFVVVRSGDFTGGALDRWLGELRALISDSYDNRRW